MSRRIKLAALTLCGIAGLLAAPGRADAQAIAGRWMANVPEGTYYFHFDPAFANTPDGGLVGRFHHGEILGDGTLFTKFRGEYILRPFGPTAMVTLRFDDGHVVTVNEHPLGGNLMRVFHNGRLEFYNRLY